MLKHRVLLFGIAFMTTVASTQAASTIYTTSSSFTAAAPGTTLQNFDSSPNDFSPPISVTGFTVSQYGSNQGLYLGNTSYGTNQALEITTNTGGGITFTFASAITAFAFNVYDLGTLTGTTSLTYSLSNGSSFDSGSFITGYHSNSHGVEQFFGLTSTIGFTSISIANSQDGDVVDFDNVRYGFATTAVPEPSSIALLGAGLGFVGVRLVRGRRTRS
ncbi:PEP-CTERM sorting domain-containing protein [Paludisphaera rhizosphaerae]|uniref:PEP-CTERM sorting domain-containing protein n=1 Tax=Paludisphaera rhizosphaerae TaxID=2711216 RepID=UPI0013EAB53A|nr:PEP-CTERM sorting domain-containing protein [Paludisphaera rhizosphaerae]